MPCMCLTGENSRTKAKDGNTAPSGEVAVVATDDSSWKNEEWEVGVVKDGEKHM